MIPEKKILEANSHVLLIQFQSQNNSTPQSNAFDQPLKIVYIKLPFVREISNQLSKEINFFFPKFNTNIKQSYV